MSSHYSRQLDLEYEEGINKQETAKDSCAVLNELLRTDLDFHNQRGDYATHNFHSFPAKFPPQLPEKFILGLTQPGDVVLDPMMGSGTTVLEAYLAGRRAVGLDIDPLAIMLGRVKTSRLQERKLAEHCRAIVTGARADLKASTEPVKEYSLPHWDTKSIEFLDYWFAAETQAELCVLSHRIAAIEDADARLFFHLAFSSIIITKSGGVSLALDLAHTRPHKAKVVLLPDGRKLYESQYNGNSNRLSVLTKKLRSPVEQFEKKCFQNIRTLIATDLGTIPPVIKFGNAQDIPLRGESVDLIVTSPPYASNAIDYMRAHKFSLIWLGHVIDDLSLKRKEYIGGEITTSFDYETMPEMTERIIQDISAIDAKRGKVLHRYYSEMTRTLTEMYRVLRPGKAAVVVVGSSTMRGKDTLTHECLAEIGQEIGFVVPRIGVRKLDRNKRMMPSGATRNSTSQIQNRMHEEFVIGYFKPNEVRKQA